MGFTLNPAIGIALMVVESAIVFANLYRLKHQETLSVADNHENQFDNKLQEETTSRVFRGFGFSPKSILEQQALLEKEELRYSTKSTSSRNSLQFFNHRIIRLREQTDQQINPNMLIAQKLQGDTIDLNDVYELLLTAYFIQ